MKHLGDITKINGAEVPIVDVICGGSPCQDLSVAGLRKGLQHSSLGDGETTRSGLFMEQIRIIKEMRNECIRQLQMRGSDIDVRLVRPRYMVWENVQGAFSSNKGEDFRCVLEETAKIVDKDAVIPGPAKGKWPPAGCIISDNYSLAWRTHDAQWWGVPQRRKRICLLADFNGQSAPDVLFEYVGETDRRQNNETVTDIGTERRSEVSSVGSGVCRDIEQSGKEREETPGAATDSIRTSISFVERAGKPGGGKGILIQDERTGSLQTNNSQAICSWDGGQTSPTLTANNAAGQQRMPDKENFNAVLQRTEPILLESNQNHATIQTDGVSTCLPASMGQGGGYVPMVTETYQDTTGALCASGYDKLGTQEAANDMYVVQSMEVFHCTTEEDKVQTLKARDYKDPQIVCIEGNGARESHKGDGYKESETMYTLNTVEQHAVAYGVDSYNQTASEEVAETIRTNGGGDNLPKVAVAYGVDCYNQTMSEEQSKSLTCSATDSDHVPCVTYGIDMCGGRGVAYYDTEKSPTQGADGHVNAVCYGIDRASFNQGKNAQFDFSVEEEKAQTLVSRGPGGVLTQK